MCVCVCVRLIVLRARVGETRGGGGQLFARLGRRDVTGGGRVQHGRVSRRTTSAVRGYAVRLGLTQSGLTWTLRACFSVSKLLRRCSFPIPLLRRQLKIEY